MYVISSGRNVLVMGAMRQASPAFLPLAWQQKEPNNQSAPPIFQLKTHRDVLLTLFCWPPFLMDWGSLSGLEMICGLSPEDWCGMVCNRHCFACTHGLDFPYANFLATIRSRGPRVYRDNCFLTTSKRNVVHPHFVCVSALHALVPWIIWRHFAAKEPTTTTTMVRVLRTMPPRRDFVCIFL